VEALVLHEVLSNKLEAFLPFTNSTSDCFYYTSGFLALATTQDTQTSANGRGSTDRSGVFLKDDNHLAFHRILDPAQLILPEKQRPRFARALRILGLEPHYHLSELEASINPSNKDDTFWAFCSKQMTDCPAPLQTSEAKKRSALQQYIHSKSKGKL
jgi:hypothetical protein